jgi:hypothetical protein
LVERKIRIPSWSLAILFNLKKIMEENLFVNCNNCGSSLQIENKILFTTCRNCQKPLEIVRTYNSVYTKVVEGRTWEEPLKVTKVAVKTKEIDKTDIYKQIELLDNEWQNKLPTFMTKGTLPGENSGLEKFGSILAIGFGIIWIIGMGSIFGEAAILGVIFIIAGVWNFINQHNKTDKYQFAKSSYERRRAELMEILNR